MHVEIFNNFNFAQLKKQEPTTPIFTPAIRKEALIEVKNIFTRQPVFTKIFRKDSSRLLLGQPSRGSPLDRPLNVLSPNKINFEIKKPEPEKLLPQILNKDL